MSRTRGMDFLRPFLPGLENILDDPDVSEIMINGPGNVWVEIRGEINQHPAPTLDGAALDRAAIQIARPLGLDPASSPILDARLDDGSRVAICVPPAAPYVAIIIRRFGKRSYSPEDLVRFGSLPQEVLDAARTALLGRRNILVSGGTGSGKTTLFNALVELLPVDDRIVSIEDTLELRIDRKNCVRFEARGIDSKSVTIRDLVKHALRHRPCKKEENGHSGHWLSGVSTAHGEGNMQRKGMDRRKRTILVMLLAATPGLSAAAPQAGTWRGLVVAPEYRCAPYDPDDYGYSQNLELSAIAAMGGRIYGPYSGRTFARRTETDIEHIVARSEAHDSGLCAVSAAAKRAFANDMLNITLASPELNRVTKNDRDAAGWMPAENRCWFAGRVLAVRLKYRLSIDRAEVAALEAALAGCTSTALVFVAGPSVRAPAAPASIGATALERWDDNGNGRITCAEARAHGIAPVRRDHPAYPYMVDGDGDGIVCE